MWALNQRMESHKKGKCGYREREKECHVTMCTEIGVILINHYSQNQRLPLQIILLANTK